MIWLWCSSFDFSNCLMTKEKSLTKKIFFAHQKKKNINQHYSSFFMIKFNVFHTWFRFKNDFRLNKISKFEWITYFQFNFFFVKLKNSKKKNILEQTWPLDFERFLWFFSIYFESEEEQLIEISIRDPSVLFVLISYFPIIPKFFFFFECLVFVNK